MVPSNGALPSGFSRREVTNKQVEQTEPNRNKTNKQLIGQNQRNRKTLRLCSRWLAGVHSRQCSWEDFCCCYLILLPVRPLETLLLTVHSTGSGEVPLPKVLALLHPMNSPDSKGSCSALLQDSKTGCHSRRGSLQHKSPVVFCNCRSTSVCLFATTLSSAFPKCIRTSQKLPRNKTWGCSHPPLGTQDTSTGALRAGATAVGLSEDRMQQPVRIYSSSRNERHWETTSSCHWQKALFFSFLFFFLNRKRFYDTQPKRSASRHGAT